MESLDNVTPDKTVAYAYNDDTWGDLLTTYDNQGITYDNIGNPVNDGTWTYEWQRGRQLKSMSEIGGDTVWTYTYDSNGMRTGRTDGTTTYSYVYNGSQLVQMTVGNNTLRFTYDAAGTPLSVNYNGTTYYYVTNLQGDVTGIISTDGTSVVQYTYSCWGALLSTTGTMAEILGELNPIRYRGYVYDTEAALYYLQSRYYDPNVGRFINLDKFTSTGQGLLGLNMFTYCLNQPVLYADFTGSRACLPRSITFSGGKTENETQSVPDYNDVVNYQQVDSFGLVSHVDMSHVTLYEETYSAGALLGEVSFSETATRSSDVSSVFYSYSDVGPDEISYGIGVDANGWLGADIGISSGADLYVNMQITPLLHGGISVGASGIGVNVGVDFWGVSYDVDIKIGWGLGGIAAFLFGLPTYSWAF